MLLPGAAAAAPLLPPLVLLPALSLLEARNRFPSPASPERHINPIPSRPTESASPAPAGNCPPLLPSAS